jgi:hypothetical protein
MSYSENNSLGRIIRYVGAAEANTANELTQKQGLLIVKMAECFFQQLAIARIARRFNFPKDSGTLQPQFLPFSPKLDIIGY